MELKGGAKHYQLHSDWWTWASALRLLGVVCWRPKRNDQVRNEKWSESNEGSSYRREVGAPVGMRLRRFEDNNCYLCKKVVEEEGSTLCNNCMKRDAKANAPEEKAKPSDTRPIEHKMYGVNWKTCKICKITDPEVGDDETCKNKERCAKVIRGEPLSDDHRFGKEGPKNYEDDDD